MKNNKKSNLAESIGWLSKKVKAYFTSEDNNTNKKTTPKLSIDTEFIPLDRRFSLFTSSSDNPEENWKLFVD